MEFLIGERTRAENISIRLFHRRLEENEYAGLAGAPDDAQVQIGALRGALYLEMGKPAAYRGYYYIRRVAGKLALLNDGFHIFSAGLRGRGLGLRIFLRQVQSAGELGIRRIDTVAGRRRGENGYYTWPRYGFDAPLPERLRGILPPPLETHRTLLDLMESEAGRQWWREHGGTIRATFHLAPHSRSQWALGRYLQSKKISGGTKTNLENPPAIAYGGVR
ncbi:MAG: hypothetical protein JW959_01760 [Pirellulales bacterium]|nr:hypothetical protein [Pirellulales bacterium]